MIQTYLYEHDILSGIAYSPGTNIFGLTNDFSLGDKIARVSHFVDYELNFIKYIHSSQNNPHHFHDFVKGTSKVMMADTWQDGGRFYVLGICIAPYTISSDVIEIDIDEEACMDGSF